MWMQGLETFLLLLSVHRITIVWKTTLDRNKSMWMQGLETFLLLLSEYIYMSMGNTQNF